MRANHVGLNTLVEKNCGSEPLVSWSVKSPAVTVRWEGILIYLQNIIYHHEGTDHCATQTVFVMAEIIYQFCKILQGQLLPFPNAERNTELTITPAALAMYFFAFNSLILWNYTTFLRKSKSRFKGSVLICDFCYSFYKQPQQTLALYLSNMH